MSWMLRVYLLVYAGIVVGALMTSWRNDLLARLPRHVIVEGVLAAIAPGVLLALVSRRKTGR